MRNFSITLQNILRDRAARPCISALAGCNVGPNTSVPATPRRPLFAAQMTPLSPATPQNSLGDEQWSQVFREPELQELIRTALTNNYDVRIAAQRVLEQQAQVRITRSQEFPQITGGGTGIGATLPAGTRQQHRQPAGRWQLQSRRRVDAGLLGPLSQADRSRPRAAAGANLGAARGSPDAGAAGRHHLYCSFARWTGSLRSPGRP